MTDDDRAPLSDEFEREETARLRQIARAARERVAFLDAELDRYRAAVADSELCGCPVASPVVDGCPVDGQSWVVHRCGRNPLREIWRGVWLLRLFPEIADCDRCPRSGGLS